MILDLAIESKMSNYWRDIKVRYSTVDAEIITDKITLIVDSEKILILLSLTGRILTQATSNIDLSLLRRLAIKDLLENWDITIYSLCLNKEDYTTLIENRKFNDYERIPCKKCGDITHYGRDDWICNNCGDVYCQICIDQAGEYDQNEEDWFCNKCI